LERLNLPEFKADSYAQAIAETPVQKGEDAVERRMREISYLHLTRFVQFLLDRKDGVSMAVGLEVRVPFCDHRLVDYVFNIPWHLKTFDGREKSILRAATRKLLPNSIAERLKSPYPSTQDPAYEKALRAEVAEVLENRSHPATSLLNRKVVKDLLARPLGTTSSIPERAGLERARSISACGEGLRRRAGPVVNPFVSRDPHATESEDIASKFLLPLISLFSGRPGSVGPRS
jgi:asparagine synthase (glutamine-hydrolysing)